MATTGRPRGRPPKSKTNTKSYNPKSRENLRQYSQGKQSAEQAKMIKAITTEIEIEIPPEMLEVIIPTKKVFSNEETKRFLQLLKLHLKELSNDDKITFADIQSVAELCRNIIMADRLLADSQTRAKEDPTAIVNVMASIDKLNKRNKDLSDSLATNRNVRIDPKAGGNITILDLLEAYEVGETASIAEKLAIMEKEEAEEAGPDKYQTTVDGMIR
jgi:hypothetical protein